MRKEILPGYLHFPLGCVYTLDMNHTTETTTNTPGFNCRIRIFFTYDKNGKKRARYMGKANPFRSFPLPLIDAELFIAQEQADYIG